MNYSEKLKDPRWQKKRLEIMQRDDFTCQLCNSKEKTLHVHHKTYIYSNEPWDYPSKNLITLCMDCHEEEGFNKEQFNDTVHDLLIEGYNYDQLRHLLSQLIFPVKDLTKDERVRSAAVCASNSDLLKETWKRIQEGWNNFFKEVDEDINQA